jgi:hypothetical protein
MEVDQAAHPKASSINKNNQAKSNKKLEQL